MILPSNAQPVSYKDFYDNLTHYFVHMRQMSCILQQRQKHFVDSKFIFVPTLLRIQDYVCNIYFF